MEFLSHFFKGNSTAVDEGSSCNSNTRPVVYDDDSDPDDAWIFRDDLVEGDMIVDEEVEPPRNNKSPRVTSSTPTSHQYESPLLSVLQTNRGSSRGGGGGGLFTSTSGRSTYSGGRGSAAIGSLRYKGKEILESIHHKLSEVEQATKEKQRKAAKRTVSLSENAPVTKDEFFHLQEVAILFNVLLTTSESYKSLTTSGQGVTMQTSNPFTNKLDIVFLKGITETMKEKLYPDATYHKVTTDVKNIPGALRTFPENMLGGTGRGAEAAIVVDDMDYKDDTDWMFEQAIRESMQSFGSSTSRRTHSDERARNSQRGNSGGGKVMMEIRRTKTPPIMSATAIRFNALKRGSEAHKKMELYSKAYVHTIKKYNGKIDNVLDAYQTQIEMNGLEDGSTPDVQTILSVYAMPQYQFIPVAAELPVYNTKQVSRYFRERARGAKLDSEIGVRGMGPLRSLYRGFGFKPSNYNINTSGNNGAGGHSKFRVFGTLLDAVVLAPHLNNSLAVLEFKFTTGDFTKNTGRMRKPLDFMGDSHQNQAIVQLTLGIEYFRRTYFDQIMDNENLQGATREIHGFVICTPPTGGKFIVEHVKPEMQRTIIKALSDTEFLSS